MTQTYDIALLPGDGTGIEVAAQAERVLHALGELLDIRFKIDEIPCGGQYYLEHGQDWPDDADARCRAADLILLGAVGWPSPDGTGPVTMENGKMAGYSPVIGNRLNLDLYANVRPVKLFEGVKTRISGERKQVWDAKNVDMVFLRENTEGLYTGIGGVVRPGGVGQVASDTRIITRNSSERVIRMAFELAMQRNGAPADGKKRVTCIVKNNVLSGCRFFYEIYQEIAQEYPEVEQDVAIIDAFTQWLIGQPEYYDVLVTTNMFGDIVTDLASVLQGGMGMAVGCNVGDEYAMFEPIHGSTPRHAGKDKVNPIAMLMATAEGLRWLARKKDNADLKRGGDAIEAAIKDLIKVGEPLTYDMVGNDKAATMTATTDAVISRFAGLLS